MTRVAEELLAEHIDIHSPALLFDVAASLRDFIAQGMLREVGGNCSVKDIQKGKSWLDDIILIEFETVPGGTRYLLSCETHHGRGGVFKKV
jgi:hypothetical protein